MTYGRPYRSKKSAGAKRKQYRKKSTSTRKRTGMRKTGYRKNTQLIPSAEKKYIEHGYTGEPFAQLDVISNAYEIANVTPNPLQNFTRSGRVGNKIFLTGGIMDLQLTTLATTSNAIKYKWFLVKIPSSFNFPAVDIVTQMFDPNPFLTGIYDWHSNLDPEERTNFRIVAKGQGTIKPDSIAGQTGIVQIRKYLKYGFPLKWDTNNPNEESVVNQMRLIFFADSGNLNLSSGITASANFRSFYLDN